jgi:hypothetical protein
MSALLATLLLAAATPESTLDCGASDAHGHSFATCFDPWQGLELGGGVLVDGTGLGASAHAALRLRGERESRSKAESTWLSLHRIGATEVRPVQGRFGVSVLGYTGVFRRHVREGKLLLPFTPPVSIPFPLDMSFMAEVLKYERRFADGSGTDWSLEPVRLSFLLDPVRSASSRFHLSLGVTGAWRVLQVDGALFHEVTPLSAATLFFDFESEDGLWLARGTLSGGWNLTVPAPAPVMTLRARGEVELSRVLFAVNDQPLALYVRASGAFRDAGARGATEWTAQAGVQLRLFSSRR